jgi:cyanophycinase-like exopeptidase
VLAGSGEYTPGMDRVDSWLVERCKGSVLLIATSCAQEGADVMTRWEQMGVKHFAKFGVEATPLRIVDHADANKAEFADQIANAAIVWFSGGSPPYLASAFHQTVCWEALEAANRNGTAVAGSSGGLGVLNQHVEAAIGSGPNAQQYMNLAGEPAPNALGLAAPVRALAHFDRAEARRPEFVQRIVEGIQPGQMAVGTDEDTAVVWTGDEWRAMGQQRVVVFLPGGERAIYHHGEVVTELPPPLRAVHETPASK